MRKNPALPLLRLQAQRAEADCAIACLASLVGVPYEDVLLEAGKDIRGGEKPHQEGLYLSSIMRTAERLSCPLKKKRKCDVDLDAGILSVAWRGYNCFNHVVLLVNRLIIDMSDVTIWDPEDYKRYHGAKFGSILIVA